MISYTVYEYVPFCHIDYYFEINSRFANSYLRERYFSNTVSDKPEVSFLTGQTGGTSFLAGMSRYKVNIHNDLLIPETLKNVSN